MPARKPRTLHTRHATRAEIDARDEQERLLRSERALPAEPVKFADHPVAGATWRRLMREFDGVDGVIVTRLDMDLLIDYCMLVEQLSEIDEMRHVAYEVWDTITKSYKSQKDYGLDEDAEKLAIKVVDAFDAITKLDSRADRKRDLLLKIRQSLYLTPRARAGVAPKTKEEKPPADPFEEMLNQLPRKVSTAVDSGSDDDR